MTDQHWLETFPARGRQVVLWDPADQESVERARAEFERLKTEGYILFAFEERPGSSVERQSEEFAAGRGSFVARSPIPVQADAFAAEAVRFVAVKPARGG